MKRNLALDSFRGLFALAIAIGHGFSFNGRSAEFPGSFGLAVDFFFVLSGFVLTASVLSAKQDNFDVWLGDFIKRRICRLWPVYLTALALTIFVVLPFFRHKMSALSIYQTVCFLLLGQDTGLMLNGIRFFSNTSPAIAWSVSVEFWLGLFFFPFVYWVRRRQGVGVLVTIAMGGFSLILLLHFCPPFAYYQFLFGTITFDMLRGLVGFSFGYLCYIVYLRMPILTLGHFLELAIVLWIVSLYGYVGYDQQNDYLAPLLAAVLIFIFAHESGFVSRILRLGPFKLLGDLSYPIYLLHPVAMDLIRGSANTLSNRAFIAYLALTLVLSYATHKLIEVPGIKFARRKTITAAESA